VSARTSSAPREDARSALERRPSDPQGDLLTRTPGDRELTDLVLEPLWTAPRAWYALVACTGLGALGFLGLTAWTMIRGIGLWGNNIPVAWAFAIINFVWWIGLGHAGTFISAILLLLEQRWRGSVNRIAEAMTLFAIAMAGIFPILHLGRPWFAYWLVPYPSTMDLWPQFMSTLPWDVAAIATYGVISLLFWYLGLVPDLAAARDRAPTRRRAKLYAIAAVGWTGSARDWARHRVVYGVLAGIAAPLVISVHSIVSMDFADALVTGWHQTFYPPYFVVGAIYSGFALVLMLLVPIRRFFGWTMVITERHLEACAKIMLAMGWLLLYAYVVELFIAWYSGSEFERYLAFVQRPFGTHGAWYWALLVLNFVPLQLLWMRRFRRSGLACFAVGTCVFVGMWLERFIIVVASLERDFLPSSWSEYAPTWVDLGLLALSISTFCFLFLLFLKWVPAIPIAEVKEIAHARTRLEKP
jgi:Ni/Fe-hydrogenase subunit HybB-like protein